jgi:subtilisin family serine protease
MKRGSIVGAAMAMLLAAAVTPVAAAPTETSRSIVRIKSTLIGRTVIQAICGQFNCQVLRSLDGVPGETGPSSLFLVRNLPAPSWLVNYNLLGIEAVEPDLLATVADGGGGDGSWYSQQATAAVLDRLQDRSPVSYFGTTPWRSYLEQPAAGIVRVSEAHCALRATGGGTVAVIDTGVDLGHPTLAPVLTLGYDFTRDVEGGNERADVDQATAAVLDRVFGVNQATAAVLDQATAAVLDGGQHTHFGHGTMVAGMVHLAAPTAGIMPLKAFDSRGQGYTSDIIRAILYAVRNGAKVLNMSFSRSTPSNEIKRALDYATSLGVIAVASAGNDGESAPRYPAAYENVMGVASTSNTDVRSPFSNYGADLVWVSAPGEGVITTYPWGSFAAVWGTSFSTPLVAGAAALLAGLDESANQGQAAALIGNAQVLTPELGQGRLDLVQAVTAARALWPNAAESLVPATCDAYGLDWSEEP